MVDIKWAGQIVDDTVKEHLHAFVLEGGAAEHGADVECQGLLAELCDQLFLGDAVGVIHVFLEQSLIVFGGTFDDHGAVFGYLFFHVIGDGHFFKMRAIVFLVPHVGFVFQQVDHADEAVFNADRQLKRNRIGVQAFTDFVDDFEEIRTCAVHFVDKANTGHSVLVSLVPHGFRLRLNAAHSAEDGDSAIEDAERALHLHCEIHMAGGVDNIDFVSLVVEVPEYRGGS